jgi:hypothetical protein
MFSSTPSFHHHYRMAFPMWIATLGKRQEHRQAGVKRRRRVYDLNHAVVSPMLQRELGDIAVPEASKLLGLVRLEPAFAYDHLRLLSSVQREQYRFWLSLSPVDLEGKLFFYNITECFLLPRPREFTMRAGAAKSVFACLDDGQAECWTQHRTRV